MGYKDRLLEKLNRLPGDRYIVIDTETNRVISLPQQNKYGNDKDVLETKDEVFETLEEYGLNEQQDDDRYQIHSLDLD